MKRRLLATILLVGAAAQANMITVGGDPVAGTAYLTINQDIQFTLTAAANIHQILFDEIVVSDGSMSILSASYSGKLSVDAKSYNSTIGTGNWIDNYNSVWHDVTVNDGFFAWDLNTPVFEVGDVVILHAGTLTVSSSDANFNLWSSGDYDVYLTNNPGDIISTAGQVVPEPATAGMLALSGGALWLIRRLKNSYRF